METERKKPGRKSRAEIQAEMTQTPEFKAAVTTAVAEALAAVMPTIEASRTRALSGTDAGDLMERLALSISELTTQGTGKVRVPPEELHRREKARERMRALLIEARAEGKVPTYQLRNKIYLNETLLEPFWKGKDNATYPTEIDFWGVPNEVMVPMNDVAKEIFMAFRESIGTVKGVHGVANQLPPEDDIAITRGGLVVRNSAINSGMRKATPPRPTLNEGPMKSAYEEVSSDGDDPGYQPLRVHGLDQKGQHKDIHVLGTIAPPARQLA